MCVCVGGGGIRITWPTLYMEQRCLALSILYQRTAEVEICKLNLEPGLQEYME